MMNLYKVVVWNNKTQETEIGIVRAESYFQAEDKGKEWAKQWEPNGYAYYATDYLDANSLEQGKVVTVS
jgi:hypothetical protein